MIALLVLVAAMTGGFAGWVAWCWREEHRADRIPALLYHRFLSKERFDRGEIASDERSYVAFDVDFAAEMQALRDDGYTTLDLDDYFAIRRGERPLPARPVLVTFDDGFRSVYLHAFPVLRRLGMKGTVFVTPDTASENFRKNAPLDEPLRPEEMREMLAQGVAIESHGMTHRYLTDLDDATIRWELTEALRAIEAITARPVRYLAIPSGAYNGTIKRIARDTGHAAVFGMGKGTIHPGSDPHALRRLVVGRDLGAAGLRRLLDPRTAFQLRLTGSVQVLVMRLFGARGLDGLRAFILRFPFGPALLRRPARLLAIGVAFLLLLGALALIAARLA